MIDRKYGIYAVINNANGKKYVGSSKNLKSRRRQHFSDLRLGKHGNPNLMFDYDWYGKDHFQFVILELCSVEDLLEREQVWIDMLHPEYNVCEKAGKSIEGYIRTEKAKDNWRKSWYANHTAGKHKKREYVGLKGSANPNFGKKWTEEQKDRLRQSVSGEKNPNYGKHRSEETRRKISEANSKVYVGLVDPDGKIYANIRFLSKFCEEHGLGLSSTVAVLRGRNKHHKGWTRYEPSHY